MAAAVASRYARALADVVLAPSAAADPDRVRQDLRAFEQTLGASPELDVALASPSVSRPRKRAIVSRLAQSLGLSGIANNFLRVLIDHRRTHELSGILEAFDKMVDERRGILQVEVIAAGELDERRRGDLARELETMTGKKVGLSVTVDRDLIGGMVVRLGATVYDGSVRGMLDALGRQLRAD